MIKRLTLFTRFATLSLTMVSTSYAQDSSLSLFEPVANEAQARQADNQDQVQRNPGNGPAFTLIGTSRIGSTYKVTLATSDGQIVHVKMTPDSTQDIPDHPGFQIVDTGARTIAISSPSSSPCIAAADKGVTCRPNGVSELALTTAAPVAVANRDNNGTAANEPTSQNETADGQPENPFAAALRAAAENEGNNRRRGGGDGFQPRRIPDEDVPPGMRRVRTPFGDRLVEE